MTVRFNSEQTQTQVGREGQKWDVAGPGSQLPQTFKQSGNECLHMHLKFSQSACLHAHGRPCQCLRSVRGGGEGVESVHVQMCACACMFSMCPFDEGQNTHVGKLPIR